MSATLSAAVCAAAAQERPSRKPEPSASAGGQTAAPSPLFRRADRDNDGYLSERELWGAPVQRGGGWIAADRDRDGRIAPWEFMSVEAVAARTR